MMSKQPLKIGKFGSNVVKEIGIRRRGLGKETGNCLVFVTRGREGYGQPDRCQCPPPPPQPTTPGGWVGKKARERAVRLT
jgi:hypothetical protein